MRRARGKSARSIDEEVADNPVKKGSGLAQPLGGAGANKTRECIVDQIVRFLARAEASAQTTPELRRLVAIEEVEPLAWIAAWPAIFCGRHFTKRPRRARLERR